MAQAIVTAAVEKEAQRVSAAILRMLDDSKKSFGTLFDRKGVKISLRSRGGGKKIRLHVDTLSANFSVLLTSGTGRRWRTGNNLGRIKSSFLDLNDLERSQLSQTF